MQPLPYGQPLPGTGFGSKMAPPLYIGDLDETIQEEYLFDLFSRYGPLHSVRIMKDSATGLSRGYGFVNFMNARDAESARQFEQYTLLGSKRIRIMFKRPINEMSPDANIYVKNLDPAVDVKELHAFFNTIGTVVSAKVAESRGVSLGYGYVQFETPEDARKALELNGTKLKESIIEVEIFVPRDKRVKEVSEEQSKTNLYVKNLPKADTEAFVQNLFSQFGELTNFAVKPDNLGRPAAFVIYKDQQAAQRAFDSITRSPILVEGEPIYVNWLQSRGSKAAIEKKDCNLYIKNLKLTTTDKELYTAFSNFGRVTSTATKETVQNEKKVKSGFVAFDNSEDARKAQFEGATNENVKALFEREDAVYITIHQNRAVRSKFLANQRRGMGMVNPYMMSRNIYSQPYFGNQFQSPYTMGGMPFVRGDQGFRRPYNPNRQRNFQYQGGQQRDQQGGQPRDQQGGQQREGGQPYQPRQYGGDRPYQPRNNNYGGNRQGGFNQNRQNQQRPDYQGGFTQNRMPNQYQQQNPVQGQKPQQQQIQQVQQQIQQIQPKPTPKPEASSGNIISVADLRKRLDEFIKLDAKSQMRILGELLFPLIRRMVNEQLAPKITGMLIDLTVLEVSDILEMLESPSALKERVDEAVELLNSA